MNKIILNGGERNNGWFLLAVCLLYSCVSFSQKITYKQLVGRWEASDTSNQQETLSFKFIDSVSVTLYSGTTEAGKFRYNLDTLTGLTLIHIEPVKQLRNRADLYWLFKMPDENTLKCQGSNGFGKKPEKWNDNETVENTTILIKKN